MQIGCPAISFKDRKHIDPTLCIGCEVVPSGDVQIRCTIECKYRQVTEGDSIGKIL